MLESTLRFAPPPRRLPFSLALVSSLNALVQIGFALFGFGSIFLWTFVANADFSFITFRGELANVAGRVTRVVDTNAKENRSVVRANYYEYSVAGRTFTGVSYSTGESVNMGDPVAVEYSVSSPQRSRIAGQRRSMFSPLVSFVAIFPLIGLGMIIGGARWGGRRARLLRDGVLTSGVLVSKTATNTRVNNRRLYELTFEFTSRDGRRCRAKARTSMTHRLEDEREEPLLYDPENPDDAVMLDDAPSRPQLDDTGGFAAKPVAAFFAMLLPALVIAANTLALLAHLP